MLNTRYGSHENLSINIAPEVPPRIYLDQFLFNLILGNALSNTTMHGKKGGNVEIDVFKVFQKTPNTNNQRFCVTLVNEPGDKHAQNLQIQADMGDNYLLDAGTKSWSSQIGCDTSTFLGEIPTYLTLPHFLGFRTLLHPEFLAPSGES